MDYFCDCAGSDRDCDMEVLSMDGDVSGTQIARFVSLSKKQNYLLLRQKVYLLKLERLYIRKQEPGEWAAAHWCAGNICRPGFIVLSEK